MSAPPFQLVLSLLLLRHPLLPSDFPSYYVYALRECFGGLETLQLLESVVPSDDGSCSILPERVHTNMPLLYSDSYWPVGMPWHTCKLVMTVWKMRRFRH